MRELCSQLLPVQSTPFLILRSSSRIELLLKINNGVDRMARSQERSSLNLVVVNWGQTYGSGKDDDLTMRTRTPNLLTAAAGVTRWERRHLEKCEAFLFCCHYWPISSSQPAAIIHNLIICGIAMISSIVRSTVILLAAHICCAESLTRAYNFIGDNAVGSSAFCMVSSMAL